jgi:simple sugar transport system ATP-binding protein
VNLAGDKGAGKAHADQGSCRGSAPDQRSDFGAGKFVHGWDAAQSRAAGIETAFQDHALAVQRSITRKLFNRPALGALAVAMRMLVVFLIGDPKVF